MGVDVVLTDPSQVKAVKTILEQNNLLRKPTKIKKNSHDGSFSVPTLLVTDDTHELTQLLEGIEYTIHFQEDPTADSVANLDANKKDFKAAFLFYLKEQEIESLIDPLVLENLLSTLPTKWSLYPPVVLFSFNTFDSECWVKFFDKFPNFKEPFLEFIINTYFKGFTHLAINKPIIEQNNEMRSPHDFVVLFGEPGQEVTQRTLESPTAEDFNQEIWSSAVQNGIYQTWAPKYTMFSRGNIKEKKRVLDTFPNIENNAVVDLYCGIGYFTFSYLKRNAQRLFCWEINPWSIMGIIKGAQANKFTYMVVKNGEPIDFEKFNDVTIRLIIFHESNEFATERFEQIKQRTGKMYPITHINLGLLPTSKPSWPICCDIINRYSTAKSTDIHIHENIGVDELDSFMETTSSFIQENFFTSPSNTRVKPLLLEKVKTFAPGVWHIVGDFTITKNQQNE